VNRERLDHILGRFPGLTIGLLGDFFLDRYLDLDASLTEKSLETGLDAYQVTRIRNFPGAGGTVANNLAALGVGTILPITVIGDDDHACALRNALADLPVSSEFVFECRDRFTPTYTKPMLCEKDGETARELNRLDVKNRSPLPEDVEEQILAALEGNRHHLDALVVADQVEERNCGVVTDRIREAVLHLGRTTLPGVIFVDSRVRIGEFRDVITKPNEREARAILERNRDSIPDFPALGKALAKRTGRPVFITRGEKGLGLFHNGEGWVVPAYPSEGPLDIVGAGDSTTAGIVASLAAGASLVEAGLIGVLTASITVQQIGVTGTASREDVGKRLEEYAAKGLEPRKISPEE